MRKNLQHIDKIKNVEHKKIQKLHSKKKLDVYNTK